MADRKVSMNLGTTGLKESGGYIFEEFVRNLQGPNGVKLYNEMANNNSVIGTILYIIDMIVRQIPWHAKTPEGLEDDPEAMRQREFLQSAMGDMEHSFGEFISEALSLLIFGWAYFEKVLKVRKGETRSPKTNSKFDDGFWGWRKLELRSQDSLMRWAYNDDHDLKGMIQLDTFRGGGTVLIPSRKAIHFKTRSIKSNPEGKSLLRPIVRDYWFSKRLQEAEATGYERDLQGMPVMQVPLELLHEDLSPVNRALRNSFELLIQQVRLDQRYGAMIPAEENPDGTKTGYKFSLMSSGGIRNVKIDDPIKRYDSRMAMAFSAEFVMIGMDKVGTHAADKSKKGMFKQSLETILNCMIAETFNKQAVEPLMRLNGFDRKFWPSIVPGNISAPELEPLGKFIVALSEAGVLTPNRNLENTLLDMGGLPLTPDADTEVFRDPTRPTPRDVADQGLGIMSPSQVDVLINLNERIVDGKLTLDVAANLAAEALGMDEKSVRRFLLKEPEILALVPAPTPTIEAPDTEEGEVDA